MSLKIKKSLKLGKLLTIHGQKEVLQQRAPTFLNAYHFYASLVLVHFSKVREECKPSQK